MMHARRPSRRIMQGGFTLIEILVTLLLMSIAIPPIMQGIQVATRAASVAKRRDEASNLASDKLMEIVAAQSWQTGSSSGDFAPDWPDFRWQCTANTWVDDITGMDMEQLDVTVSWTEARTDHSITLSTLVFLRNTTQ